jgi:hypothetical protein
MKRTTRAVRNVKEIERALEFVREHALVQEVDDTPVVTSKGEQLLNELSESAGQSRFSLKGGPLK